MEFNPGNPDEAFGLICESLDPPEEIRPFSRQLVLGVDENRGELDRRIGEASRNWRLERMPLVDRNVLRLALFEVLFLKDVPPKVSIDEAVEMGKRYGSDDSGAFINGILDSVYHHMTGNDEPRETSDEAILE